MYFILNVSLFSVPDISDESILFYYVGLFI